jgi:hypothetical protein
MPSVEESVKIQFSQVFPEAHWPLFKRTGEVYLRQAALLRKKRSGALRRLCAVTGGALEEVAFGRVTRYS